MLDLQLSELSIAEEMKEQIDVVSVTHGRNYDADNPATFTVLASAVDAVVLQSQSPQTILPTGEVIQEPDFKCYMFIPLEVVDVGDLVIRSTGPRLQIVSVYHPNNTQIMILGLQRAQ